MADALVLNNILVQSQDFALKLFSENIDTVVVGDDDTAPTIGDTGVGNQIGLAVLEEIDKSVPGQLTFIAKFGVSAFIGDNIKEAVLRDSVGAEAYSRSLTVQRVKSSDQIFWTSTVIKATAKNKNT